MDKVIKGFKTKDGILKIDYNSLANLPEDAVKKAKQLQYYGDADIEPSDESLFAFTLNEDGESYSVVAAWEVTDTSVTSIVIPYEYKGLPVTTLGRDSFKDRDALKSVTIPNSVTSIGIQAFYSCYSLNRIPIPNSVTSIGASAFADTELLQKIEIPNTVTNIGLYAFTGAEFEKIVIPHNVSIIAEGTFFTCDNLKNVTIPQSVMNIGRMAFFNCTSLTDIYYEGSPSQWEQITIEANNDPLLNANIHFGYVDEKLAAFATEREDGLGWDLSGAFLQASEGIYTPLLFLHGHNGDSSISLVAEHDGISDNLIINSGGSFKGIFRTDAGGKFTAGANNRTQIWSSEKKSPEGDGVLTVGEDSLTYTINTGMDDNGYTIGNTYKVYHEGNKPDLSAVLETGSKVDDIPIFFYFTPENKRTQVDGEHIGLHDDNTGNAVIMTPDHVHIVGEYDTWVENQGIVIANGYGEYVFAINAKEKTVSGSDEMKAAFKAWLGI